MDEARIYKSDLRVCEQSEIFRRLATFNESGFGTLVAVHDETLGGRNNIFRHVEESSEIILVPLVGGVLYKDSLGNEDIVGTEEIRVFSAESGSNYQLINPYGNELINYLQIWIQSPGLSEAKSEQQSFGFTHKNTLVSLFAPNDRTGAAIKVSPQIYGSIGMFEARKDRVYTMQNPKNGLFVFVINGAFEFEDRLIESRDALSLTGMQSAEFEALSENAILLVLEIPMD